MVSSMCMNQKRIFLQKTTLALEAPEKVDPNKWVKEWIEENVGSIWIEYKLGEETRHH